MSVFTKRAKTLFLLTTLAVSAPGSVFAQQETTGADLKATMAASPSHPGPEIKGVISARSRDRMQVTSVDGTKTIIGINDSTRITTSKGFLGLNRSILTEDSLLNGLPVIVKTMQLGDALVASEITFRNNDLKTATMIRNGTAQSFDEQTAATEALRGRMGDIDQ